MFAEVLRINASTRTDRIEMTSRAERALTESGGWVIDFKQFSNISISINFEIPTKNLGRLYVALKATGLDLSRQSDEALSNHSNLLNQTDVPASLQIIFIHSEPDLRRDVPAIPG